MAQLKRESRFKREKEWQEWVRQVAILNDWLFFHPHDSRHGAAGYPDCTILKPDGSEIIFCELKVGKNKPTDAQEEWLLALKRFADNVQLGSSHPYVSVLVARPEDEDAIVAMLGGKRPLC